MAAAIDRALRGAEERGENLGRLAGTTESIREELRKEAARANELKEKHRKDYEGQRWRLRWPWKKKKKNEPTEPSSSDVENITPDNASIGTGTSGGSERVDCQQDSKTGKVFRKRNHHKPEQTVGTSYEDISKDVATKQKRRNSWLRKQKPNKEQLQEQQHQQQEQQIKVDETTPFHPVENITEKASSSDTGEEDIHARLRSDSDSSSIGSCDGPEDLVETVLKRAVTLETLTDIEFERTPQINRKRSKLSCCC